MVISLLAGCGGGAASGGSDAGAAASDDGGSAAAASDDGGSAAAASDDGGAADDGGEVAEGDIVDFTFFGGMPGTEINSGKYNDADDAALTAALKDLEDSIKAAK